MSTRAYGAEENVMLYTPYTKIAVPPGESINYSVDVINNSDEVKNASIFVEGIPRGWKYEMKAGGWTVNQISVLPGEKKNFTFKVDVPFKVNKGTYRFTLTAPGVVGLPLTVTVSEQGTYQTELSTKQPNMQGNSKSTFNFNASLKNETADQQLYALMAEAPRGWNVTFRVGGKQATSAQVEANATENISIDVNPAANVQAGSYKIPIHATTSSTSAEIELEIVVTGSYEMELTTPRGLLSTDITAGETKRIDLAVRNNGSAELNNIQLTASKPVDWEVSFEPSKIEKLTAGSTTNVTATVKASKKALPGDYITKITARTPEVNTTTEFRISVHTPMIYGWLGILIIIVVLGGVYFLFRKYGRR
jgi:hypothetical protein